MASQTIKPRLAVHKFSSCDGCQLAFLNLGEPLLTLAERIDILHFAEAGMVDEHAEVDIAFVEGSIATPDDAERIARIRANSRYVVTIGACATAGGIQALRNMSDAQSWVQGIYAQPEHIQLLATSTPIAEHIKVDLELWGCPVNGYQVVSAVNALLLGHVPIQDAASVCQECKRQNIVCVLVAQGRPCMGPVTHTGCGALCPRFQRDCYACYGPANDTNIESLGKRFSQLGLSSNDVAARLHFINNHTEPFRSAGVAWRKKSTPGQQP
jgi:coenzyme F420-reducing hydrogenase gamma subunit